jgi:hypothetical protein
MSTVSRSCRLELFREQALDDAPPEQQPVNRPLIGEHGMRRTQPAAADTPARAVSSQNVNKYKELGFSAVPAGSMDHDGVALRRRDYAEYRSSASVQPRKAAAGATYVRSRSVRGRSGGYGWYRGYPALAPGRTAIPAGDGQGHRDAGAAVHRSIDVNRAPMHLDDPPADIQAETHTSHSSEVLAGMCLIKAVEHVWPMFRRNANAVVTHD